MRGRVEGLRQRGHGKGERAPEALEATAEETRERTYRDTIIVLLADALRLGLALLKGVLVLKLGPHRGCRTGRRRRRRVLQASVG